MQTTLNRIRAFAPCGINPRETPIKGYQKLVAYLGKDFDPDAPISIATIIDSNGIDDAIWTLRSVDGCELIIQRYALWCARQSEHLDKTDTAKKCNEVTERFLSGQASQEELTAVEAAARAAWAARAAAWAAWAARAARAAAWAAVEAAQEKELRRVCERWEAEHANT